MPKHCSKTVAAYTVHNLINYTNRLLLSLCLSDSSTSTRNCTRWVWSSLIPAPNLMELSIRALMDILSILSRLDRSTCLCVCGGSVYVVGVCVCVCVCVWVCGGIMFKPIKTKGSCFIYCIKSSI